MISNKDLHKAIVNQVKHVRPQISDFPQLSIAKWNVEILATRCLQKVSVEHPRIPQVYDQQNENDRPKGAGQGEDPAPTVAN